MADYVSVDQFNHGWTFFIKKIANQWGKFTCRQFRCSGCDDWLDFNNQNLNFQPQLESQLGEGGQAKVFKAKFHGQDVAMKYIPLDKVKNGYEYAFNSYGCHEFYFQEQF